jgi:hypothetical protein
MKLTSITEINSGRLALGANKNVLLWWSKKACGPMVQIHWKHGWTRRKTRYNSFVIMQSKCIIKFSLYASCDFVLLHRQRLVYNIIHSFITSSTALCWALAAFSASRSHTQSVGLLGRGISPPQDPTYTQNSTNTHRHPCIEWDSKAGFQCSSWRRQFIPQKARPTWSAYNIRGQISNVSGHKSQILEKTYGIHLCNISPVTVSLQNRD